MNWPVARYVSDVLSGLWEPLIDPLRGALNSQDPIWNYWLMHFLADVGPEVRRGVEVEVRRIAENPTDDEIEEEAHLEAREVLELIERHSVDIA